MEILSANSKLKKHKIFSFDLPPRITCVKCNCCCWAEKGHYTQKPKDKKLRWKFLHWLTKQPDFESTMINSIKAKKSAAAIRIHGTGDYYSQDYIERWSKIIAALPKMKFYSYTKALHLDFKPLVDLDNFTLIQSYGGEYDHLINPRKPHAKIFKTKSELKSARYVDASEDDRLAMTKTKIGLIAK